MQEVNKRQMKKWLINRGKINCKHYQDMVKELHLVVIKNANFKLLGYVKVQAKDAFTKQRQLTEFQRREMHYDD